jgi:hypothetical protein
MLGDTFTVPDAIEPIIGWRSWDVEDGRFVSPDQKTVWRADGTLAWDRKCRCDLARPKPKPRPRPDRIAHSAGNTTSASTYTVTIQSMTGACVVQEHTSAGSTFVRSPLYRKAPPAPAPAPAAKGVCHCGINAFATRRLMIESRYLPRSCTAGRIQAFGEVALSGVVRKYEIGYRAELARVVRVWSLSPYAPEADQVRKAAEAAGAQYMGWLDAGAWRRQVRRERWREYRQHAHAAFCTEMRRSVPSLPQITLGRLCIATHLVAAAYLWLTLLAGAQIDLATKLIVCAVMPLGVVACAYQLWMVVADSVESWRQLKIDEGSADTDHG